MKTSRILLLSMMTLAGTGAVHAFDPAKAPARTEVAFFEPENFTDVRDGNLGTERGRDATLAQLKEYIVSHSRHYLTPGQTLTVTVTNVDLAGEFEPWRGAMFNDVRIVKDIYAPRIDLAVRLTDADGRIVKEGKRELRDQAFMMNLSINNNDPLRFEKHLIDDWLSREFRPVKSS